MLRIEYDGTPYRGWSRQPGSIRTVEDDLLDAFAARRCTDVRLRCAGRTDAGVHASAQVADVHYVGAVPPERLAHALARELPVELAVTSAAPAPPGFDARADATSRAYEYRILRRPIHSPLRARRVLHHPRPLDRDRLDAAAAILLGQHDFTACTPTRTEHVFFHRTVVESRWIERGDELVYQIRANAFLRHMVRTLVGTMLAIGRGTFPVERLAHVLEHGGIRDDLPRTAPPLGLCLVDVTWEPVDGLPLPPGWRAAWPEPPAPDGVAPTGRG